MYALKPTGQFKKDLKLCQRRGFDMASIAEVLEYLKNDGQVPESYSPHKLIGRNFQGLWECHIEPNWLLVYDIQDTINLIALARTGTHADLFKKSK